MRAVIDFLCEVISLICFCIWATLEAIYKLIIPQKGKSLSGEVAIVTGAGHGIGKELCLQLSKDGAKGKSNNLITMYGKSLNNVIFGFKKK